MKSGIYAIQNIINLKCYIGSATNLHRRFIEHQSALNRNEHYNSYLQRSYNKYGENNFKFYILANCPTEYLLKLEQWFIDNIKPEYNILEKSTSVLGFKHSEKTKQLKRIQCLNMSQEQKNQISNTLKEKYKTGELKVSKNLTDKEYRLNSALKRCKITKEKMIKIAELYNSGMSRSNICLNVGVRTSVVNNFLNPKGFILIKEYYNIKIGRK